MVTRPAAWNREQGETKRTDLWEADLKKTEKERGQSLLLHFVLFVGGGDPHRRRRKAEKKKTFPIHRFGCLHRWRRVNPCTASDGGLWSRCAAIVQMSRTFLNTVPAVLEAFLYNS